MHLTNLHGTLPWLGLLHLHPLEFNLHPLEHDGVDEVWHSHPFQLSFPDEHWRTYSLTHWQWYNSAPWGQEGSAVQDAELTPHEGVLPRGQVGLPVHLQLLDTDKPEGHCGSVFFSQEHRPWELFTGLKPDGQVDGVVRLHLHVLLSKVPERQEGQGQTWIQMRYYW